MSAPPPILDYQSPSPRVRVPFEPERSDLIKLALGLAVGEFAGALLAKFSGSGSLALLGVAACLACVIVGLIAALIAFVSILSPRTDQLSAFLSIVINLAAPALILVLVKSM